MGEQTRECLRSGHGGLIVLRGSNHDTARVQVVVQGVALAQELRGEDDVVVMQAFAQLQGVAHRNRGLDDDPCVGRVLAHCRDRGLYAGGVKVVALLVIIRGRGDYRVVGIRVCLGRVQRGLEVQWALARGVAVEERRDLLVHNRALAGVEQIHLLRHDVQRVHFMMLAEQQRHGQTHITGSGNRNLH